MEASMQLKEIDRTLIDVSGANPRKDIKGDSFKELKASVQEHGILEPLVVRPKGKDRYELVAGERRLTAAKELKLEMVPVAIRDFDDAQARVVMLLENLQREDLEPLEEAAALEELLKTGMTQEDLAKKVSKSQPWVANRVRLLKAPKSLRELVTEGKISPQHVIELLPYVEYKVFSEELLPRLKEDLKHGPVSVDKLKRNINNELSHGDGETVLNLSRFPWGDEQLKAFFDFTGCDACEHAVMVEEQHGYRKEKDRVCLNRPCFADRLNIARQKQQESNKRDHEETKKALEEKLGKKVKSLYVDTSKLGYNGYTNFYDPDFDTTDCKVCEFYKLPKGRSASLYGDEDDRHVCLKPSCYRGKKSQKTRETNKVCRAALEASELALEGYLGSRKKGFTDEELEYICDRVSELVPRSYGRGDDVREAKKSAKAAPAELETTIMRLLVKEQLGPIRSNLSIHNLKEAQRSWPFKVTKAKTPEPPKTRKVQEKRPKKKGASS